MSLLTDEMFHLLLLTTAAEKSLLREKYFGTTAA